MTYFSLHKPRHPDPACVTSATCAEAFTFSNLSPFQSQLHKATQSSIKSTSNINLKGYKEVQVR